MDESQSAIHIDITLDADKIPKAISWTAENSGRDAKAMLLAFFDKESGDTFKIDLWTKDMEVGEMDRFFYQTLRALTDTYLRATGNKELAEHMQQFAQFFGEQVKLIKGNSAG